MVLKTAFVAVSTAYCALAASIYSPNSGARTGEDLTAALALKNLRVSAPVAGQPVELHTRSVKNDTSATSNSTSNAKVLSVSSYNVRQTGALNTKDYELYLTNQDDVPMSFFHDVPLHPSGDEEIFNMVIEIPKGQNAKLEIQKEIALNPIKQKVKHSGKLKYISNIEGVEGYIGNYGSIPQTWEDPNKPSDDADTSGGDNDPVDVVDVSEIGGYPGEIKQVKLIGGLLMVDDGATDWKLLALNLDDPRANEINDVADMDKAWPGRLDSVKSWLKHYKVPQSGKENNFAYDSQCKDSAFVKDMIKTSHGYWRDLVDGKTPADDIEIINLTVEGSKGLTDADSKVCKAVEPADPKEPASIPEDQVSGDKDEKKKKKDNQGDEDDKDDKDDKDKDDDDDDDD